LPKEARILHPFGLNQSKFREILELGQDGAVVAKLARSSQRSRQKQNPPSALPLSPTLLTHNRC